MLGWPEAQRWPPELALSMQHGEALPRAAPLSRWERSGCPDLLDMVLRPTWPILVRITLTGHAAGEGSSSSCADSNSCFPGGPASSIPLSCLWKPCPFLNPPKNTYMLEPPIPKSSLHPAVLSLLSSLLLYSFRELSTLPASSWLSAYAFTSQKHSIPVVSWSPTTNSVKTPRGFASLISPASIISLLFRWLRPWFWH